MSNNTKIHPFLYYDYVYDYLFDCDYRVSNDLLVDAIYIGRMD